MGNFYVKFRTETKSWSQMDGELMRSVVIVYNCAFSCRFLGTTYKEAEIFVIESNISGVMKSLSNKLNRHGN